MSKKKKWYEYEDSVRTLVRSWGFQVEYQPVPKSAINPVSFNSLSLSTLRAQTTRLSYN